MAHKVYCPHLLDNLLLIINPVLSTSRLHLQPTHLCSLRLFKFAAQQLFLAQPLFCFIVSLRAGQFFVPVFGKKSSVQRVLQVCHGKRFTKEWINVFCKRKVECQPVIFAVNTYAQPLFIFEDNICWLCLCVSR